MIAYNLMSLFKQFVLQEKTQKRLLILKFRVFAIRAYFKKVNEQIVLKIALVKNDESGSFRYPFSDA